MEVVVAGVVGLLGSHIADRPIGSGHTGNGHTMERIGRLLGGRLRNVPTWMGHLL